MTAYFTLKNPYSEAKMLTLVTEALADVLGCPLDELDPDASIGDDLGAESLDFVEMRYNLEKRLGIVLPQKSVLDHLARLASDEPAVADGRLTEFGAHALRESLFGYSASLAREGARLHEIMQGATLRNWARLCLGIVGGLPASCPDCGHVQATIAPSGKPACAGCGTILRPWTGDDAMSASTEEWLEQRRAPIAA